MQKKLRGLLCAFAEESERADDGVPSLASLSEVAALIRRSSGKQRAAVESLIAIAEADDALSERVRAAMSRVAGACRVNGTLADHGVLPAHGFFTELRARLTALILPSRHPPHDLSEILREVFDPADADWAATLEDALWIRLVRAFSPRQPSALRSVSHGALRAIDLLTHRLAAAGEDPELVRFDPDAMSHDSPFLAQAAHVLDVTASIRGEMGFGVARDVPEGSRDHAFVLLGQCRTALERLRKRAPRTGVTIRMTYELERIEDLVGRLRLLLDTFAPDDEVAWLARTVLFKQLVIAQSEMESVRPLLARGSRLVTSEITSRAARTGEHYITRSKKEWAGMWLAAAGAGLVVACLACLKVGLASLQAPPLVEAALFSLNYAAGFALVGALGMTIATKQPAMTAAALAASIDAQHPRETRPLVETIQCLVRSQLAAILGNCLVAFPAAWALSTGVEAITGGPVADAPKASHLIHDLDPIASLALPHAMLTGVWLSLSGIVAGYVGSSIIARHVPERIARSRWLQRVIGRARAGRVGAAGGTGGGTLFGSVTLGILLGSTGTLGALLGLPIDIRHVSFASANFGLAAASLSAPSIDVGRALAGIVGIGAMNLSVSFSLSLGLALHARRISLRDLPGLARDLLRSATREWPSWILPVGASTHDSEVEPDARA